MSESGTIRSAALIDLASYVTRVAAAAGIQVAVEQYTPENLKVSIGASFIYIGQGRHGQYWSTGTVNGPAGREIVISYDYKSLVVGTLKKLAEHALDTAAEDIRDAAEDMAEAAGVGDPALDALKL